jgi:hypothetical protein
MSAISVARVLAVSASLSLILTARSGVIIYDGFDYAPERSLEGSGYNGFSWGTNVWLKHFAFSDWLTFSNSLSHSSLPTTGGHVAETNDTLGANYERKFATHVLGDGESVWFSFLAKVTQGTTWSLFLTFAGLNESKVGVQGDYYDYKIHVRIGVGYTGNVDFIDLGQNTTRLIVGRYRYLHQTLSNSICGSIPILLRSRSRVVPAVPTTSFTRDSTIRSRTVSIAFCWKIDPSALWRLMSCGSERVGRTLFRAPWTESRSTGSQRMETGSPCN